MKRSTDLIKFCKFCSENLRLVPKLRNFLISEVKSDFLFLFSFFNFARLVFIYNSKKLVKTQRQISNVLDSVLINFD